MTSHTSWRTIGTTDSTMATTMAVALGIEWTNTDIDSMTTDSETEEAHEPTTIDGHA